MLKAGRKYGGAAKSGRQHKEYRNRKFTQPLIGLMYLI